MIPDTIANHPAILASVLARADLPEIATAGSATWHPLLRASLPLMDLTGADYIRVVAGEHTIVVQRELDSLVGVIFRTGDQISKSVHRMIRRVIVPPAKRVAKPAARASEPASFPRQTEAEATAQRHDAEVRLGAIRERRIVDNEGRDSDGDLVIRDGKPHPAHVPGTW